MKFRWNPADYLMDMTEERSAVQTFYDAQFNVMTRLSTCSCKIVRALQAETVLNCSGFAQIRLLPVQQDKITTANLYSFV
jgi:hypothetical protein